MTKPANPLKLPTEIELRQMIAKQAAEGRPIVYGRDTRKTQPRPPSEKRAANADANA